MAHFALALIIPAEYATSDNDAAIYIEDVLLPFQDDRFDNMTIGGRWSDYWAPGNIQDTDGAIATLTEAAANPERILPRSILTAQGSWLDISRGDWITQTRAERPGTPWHRSLVRALRSAPRGSQVVYLDCRI